MNAVREEKEHIARQKVSAAGKQAKRIEGGKHIYYFKFLSISPDGSFLVNTGSFKLFVIVDSEQQMRGKVNLFCVTSWTSAFSLPRLAK